MNVWCGGLSNLGHVFESHSKISNLMITELFYSHILDMNRSSPHTRSFRLIDLSALRYRLIKNGEERAPEHASELPSRETFYLITFILPVSSHPFLYLIYSIDNDDMKPSKRHVCSWVIFVSFLAKMVFEIILYCYVPYTEMLTSYFNKP